MLVLRHILVATDFSPISIAPLRHALGIARRYHSRVTLLHVIDGSFFGITAPDAIAADTDCALRDGGELIAHLDKEGIAQGLKLDFTARVGPASETVLGAIGEKQSDLLVLGTHGRSGLGKLVLGSVAQKAFREALCPVLTVGPKAAHFHLKRGGSHAFPRAYRPLWNIDERHSVRNLARRSYRRRSDPTARPRPAQEAER